MAQSSTPLGMEHGKRRRGTSNMTMLPPLLTYGAPNVDGCKTRPELEISECFCISLLSLLQLFTNVTNYSAVHAFRLFLWKNRKAGHKTSFERDDSGSVSPRSVEGYDKKHQTEGASVTKEKSEGPHMSFTGFQHYYCGSRHHL